VTDKSTPYLPDTLGFTVHEHIRATC
jgi:hypothetical protein